MTITITGTKKEVEDNINVTGLIYSEKIDNPEYVSVSINDDFVLREDFDATILKEGDVVEFLYYMGGGSNC